MELPRIPFFKKYNLVLKAMLFGGILGLLYTLMGDVGIEHGYERFIAGGLIGVSIGFSLILFEKTLLFKTYSFLEVLFLKAIVYSICILLFLFVFVILFTGIFEDVSYQEILNNYIKKRLIADFTFSVLAAVFLILFLEISSLLNNRFFYNYFTGRYHHPIQEERIFMFVDVKSSTTMAEQLGDLRYSRLLQDLFNDFTDAILATEAEVYQYAGDEIILSWKTKNGLKKQRCLYCFYLLKKSIKNRQDYYLKEYNLVPEFKAGMHIGKAVTAWVGKVKKEIVYHGDLLNTTSRIQCKCNDFNHDFVISEAIKKVLPQNILVMYTQQGEILLRGKANPIKLFTVDFNF